MIAAVRVPILFSKPIFVWIGFLALILLVFEILLGHNVIKLPFKAHTRVVMLILVVVVIVHAVLAVLYFF
jgi:hypothetical protein